MDAVEVIRLYEMGEKDFKGQDLRDVNLSGLCLGGANFESADLRGADLQYADLRQANLSRANLSGADLRWTKLTEANLRESGVVQLLAGFYDITASQTDIFVGCERFSRSLSTIQLRRAFGFAARRRGRIGHVRHARFYFQMALVACKAADLNARP